MVRNIQLPSTLRHIGAQAFGGTFYEQKENNWEDYGLYIDKYLLEMSPVYSDGYYHPEAIIKDGTYLIADSVCSGSHYSTISIPSTVKIIGDGAFARMYIREINIPDGVEIIGKRAFADNNTFSVNIPASVSFIGKDAFKGVTNVLYDGNIAGAPWGGQFLNAYEKDNILYESQQKREIISYRDLNIRHLSLPTSVVKIHNDAFNKYGNSRVRALTLGPNIEEIGDRAFADFNYLDTIYSFLEEPISITHSVFGYIDFPNTLLYVPKDQIEDYLRAEVWKQFDVVPMIATTVPTEEEIVISTTENEAQIIVEVIEGASIYELTVSLFDGTLVVTYEYNSKGELQSVVYHAPARNKARSGFLFTISGLDEGTGYDLSVTAKNESGSVLYEKTVYFYTKGGDAIDDVYTESIPSTKLLRNGQVVIQRGEKVYTLTGQEVK